MDALSRSLVRPVQGCHWSLEVALGLRGPRSVAIRSMVPGVLQGNCSIGLYKGASEN